MPRELSPRSYAQGRHQGTDRRFSGKCSRVDLATDISALSDAGTFVRIEQWGSIDDGATWRFLGSCTIRGGADAVARGVSNFGSPFPELESPLLRVVVEVIGNPATIAVDSR